MTKEQFWTLNVVGGICALLRLINLVLGRLIDQSNQTLMLTQQQLERAAQMQKTIQNLAVRIAQGGRTGPAMRAVLTRQDLKVTLTDEDAAPKRKK